jgi:tRNA modification GTPase
MRMAATMKHTVPQVSAFDTICALSSGSLPSGVAIIRVSGSQVRFVIETIADTVPTPRTAQLKVFKRLDGSPLDHGLLVYFAAPASFTGEDVVEFHVHGGRAVVAALLQDICVLPGCRLAEAGEFTRRAFVNGKIDLLGAEVTADLVTAETEGQRRFAALASDGRHAAFYEDWRYRILQARATVEAELDFSDQDDVEEGVAGSVWADIASLASEIHTHVAGYGKAEVLRDGFRVVLVGPPNAGKSSLLNALARRDVAIVTDEPGTTRDAIDVRLDLGGLSVIVTDTAGFREGQSRAEQIGIERSVLRAREADLLIEVEDASAPSVPWSVPGAIASRLRVVTKIDLMEPASALAYDHALSSLTGAGINALLDDIAIRAQQAAPSQGELVPWRQRHVDLLQNALWHLAFAVDSEHVALELRAEELRLASDALGRIAGRVDVEDILGSIFSTFCVGK